MTIRDIYPVPKVDECIVSLREASTFTILDCISEYWLVPVAGRNRRKIAFACNAGLSLYGCRARTHEGYHYGSEEQSRSNSRIVACTSTSQAEL